jgi:hypothetical protein
VFSHLKPLLDPKGGVIFGTTILGKGIRRNFLAKALMHAYNAKGIFANLDDNAADLENILKANFPRLFSAYHRMRSFLCRSNLNGCLGRIWYLKSSSAQPR